MPHRVLVTDKVSEEGLALLRAEPDFEVIVRTELAKDAAGLRAALAEADALVVRSGTQVTAEVLQGQTRLRELVTLLEPAITVGMGAVVAVVVLSVMLPMFDLATFAQKGS